MDPFIGEIRIFTGNFAPTGWFLCQGQLLPISAYQALFAIIGTFYGGNGTSNFQLPNLQGRFPIGVGQAPSGQIYNIGQIGGVEQIALTINNLPAHSHIATFTGTAVSNPPAVTANVQGASVAGNSTLPTNNYIAGLPKGSTSGDLYVNNPASGTLGNIAGVSGSIPNFPTPAGTVAVQNAGNGLPFSPTPLYLAISYIIAYNGIFPSRG
jgi:microcystin-dependent protein